MENNLKKMCEEVLKSVEMKDMVDIRFSIMMDIIRLCKKRLINEDDRYFWIDYVYDLCKEHMEHKFSQNIEVHKFIIHKLWYEQSKPQVYTYGLVRIASYY